KSGLQIFFDFFPGARRLILIIWPFLVIVAVLLWLSSESMSVLVAVRSFSEGESLWSKGQKEAVFHLMRYAETHSEADYQKYRDAILVPRGDRKARIELERPDPDYTLVWQGLIEGRTHPDDIPHVIKLYRRFRQVSFMAEVIEIWDEADRMVDELILAADQLHERASSLNATEQSLRPILHQILDIDARSCNWSAARIRDRKSTRLNSSHRTISYAV